MAGVDAQPSKPLPAADAPSAAAATTMKQKPQRPPNLLEGQSIISKSLFSWPWPLLKLGQSKILNEDDLPSLSKEDTSDFNLEFMEKLYAQSMDEKGGDKFSLHRALLWDFIKSVWWVQPIYGLESACKILQAVALGKLIDTFSKLDDPTEDPEDGYVWAGVLVACGFVILQHHHIYLHVWRRGMQYRTAAVAAIYAKSLRLRSNVAGGDPNSTNTAGMVMNLASNDVERFVTTSLTISYLFWGPIEAIGALIVGISILGPVFAVGYALLFAIILPVQITLSKKFAHFRTKIAALTDKRVSLVSQAISGVRVMKMSGWETSFEERIAALREREMREIQRVQRLKSLNAAIFSASNTVVSAVIFVVYVYTGGELSTGIVFSTISLMSAVQVNMVRHVPLAMMNVAEVIVSLHRIHKFLSAEELKTIKPGLSGCNHFYADTNAIHLVGVTCHWNKEAAAIDDSYAITEEEAGNGAKSSHDVAVALKNINLNIGKSDICCIIGPVGCGKSALLLAIAGELPCSTGYITRRYSSLAYASQDAWVMNGTIRDNIVVGQAYDQNWYNDVVTACGLNVDFARFSNSDLTVVGDRGVQCSGGQKARIGLARALYSDADILLLDDPLSAVDSKVGRLIYSSAIHGLRVQRGKGVILVTHQHQFVGDSRCILMSNGQIKCDGTFEECINTVGGGLDAEVVQYDILSMGDEDRDFIEAQGATAMTGEGVVPYANDEEEQANVKEQSSSGKVKRSTFAGYANAMGGAPIILLVLLLFLSAQVSNLFTLTMMGKWAEDDNQDDASNYAFIAGLTLIVTIVASCQAGISNFFMLKASQNLHDTMTHSVLRATMEFFDTNPSGRILNRFSADVGVNDDMLPDTLYNFLMSFFFVLGGAGTAIAVLPFILLSVPPLLLCFGRMRSTFLSASREIKRLESVARSPIFAMLGESLGGISTIRPNNSVKFFHLKFKELHDNHTRAFFSFIAVSRWLGFRLDLIMFVFSSLSCILAVVVNTKGWYEVDPAVLGLALTMLIQLGITFQWCVRQSAEVVNSMVSSERILAFIGLASEAPLHMPCDTDNENWPENGKIEFKDITVQYRDDLPPSLNGISFCVEGGERVGIVGRTGSGKSTLMQALFRLLEAKEGLIRIDGVEIATLGLLKVRKGMSVIPQTPFLFGGCTVRENLDPFEAFDERAIFDALKHVQMLEVILELPLGLDSVVAEGGSNFSVGQRQLLCLARAILRTSKILVLDEPTANVDINTDKLLQEAVVERFQGSTILAVAHSMCCVHF
uniref:ATP-dependent transporter ycf16 n=1 Tax=Leptocylindrus danicus TaxID=163516 RepID=A0A7S2L9K9_9STRA|mmetsp:Transcript_33764/g.48893  ORF Transcript_33764/g.48893 Transcript_33764/m.48893 type:complete len:1276 (+) Transcript_33764:173-4000(+)